jgi:Tol biopolymer transport system component
MKLPMVAVALSIVAGVSLPAKAPAAQSSGRPTQDASALLPADVKIDQLRPTADAKRIYFVNAEGEIWLYAPAARTLTRLDVGPVWDLNVSPAGNALAYTKSGADRGEQHVCVRLLDPATGLARGPERQIGVHSSDVPAISPDGKSVAFARDDPSGVGQTLVIAPIGGGTERAVAPRLPSSLGNIRWTPDGKTLFFGVNPPVACVPGWSCLPLAPDQRDPPGAIERVAASGGTITTVVTARDVAPGLSPDGTTLMFADVVTNAARQWIIANADGTRRDTVTLPAGQAPVGWLRGSTVLIRISDTRGRVGAVGSPSILSIVSMDVSASHSQRR